MGDQASAIGRRVRYWRTRRNLSRQQFADRVGRSTSWVDKVELDLTQALAGTGRHNDAVGALYEAERIAPEEVRCRPLAHDLIRSLLEATSGETGRLVRELANRAGVTA
jgi:transcriptional regulator with XRE-family HTH domain